MEIRIVDGGGKFSVIFLDDEGRQTTRFSPTWMFGMLERARLTAQVDFVDYLNNLKGEVEDETERID